MESEFQILNNIGSNENATQRDIARDTGMSLGNVNTLIKRLVKKGLIKVEKLTPRSIKYILTSKGIKEKASRTYQYVLSSCKYFIDINYKIESIIALHSVDEITQVFLFGAKDEIYELLEGKLHQLKIPYLLTRNLDDLHDLRNKIVIVWHPEYVEILISNSISFVNLLDKI